MRFGSETGRGSGYTEHMRIDGDGNVRFGTSAEHYPAAYDRKTVIVAGKINQQGDLVTSGTTSSNAISSSIRNSTGDYTVTFVKGTFTSIPIVTVTPFRNDAGEINKHAVIKTVSLTDGIAAFNVKTISGAGSAQNAPFSFIAIGER